ncbi:MAG: hypothetical protein HZB26_22255 [Candidatus Hydrogenedentes bacterium]|nr:hypothetical protein [Candidatus Hydrogenedentota bacterium]
MTHAIVHPPISRIAELESWSQALTRIAAEPLEFCPGFPRIARRFEAWWNQELLDRPIFIASTNSSPARPIRRRLELLHNPAAWFEAKRADVAQTRYLGDAIPFIRTDFGPVFLGALLGGDLEFGADTGWTHAFINDDWSNAPDWILREDNPWWLRLRELTELVASDARGRYLVCTPDLGGSADVLLNLRGSQGLCMDVMMEPDRVRAAVDAIYPAWRRAFSELYRIALCAGAGIFHWLTLWSNRPYMIPACDFNYMIGPEQFNAVCLPDIARQAATVGRAVFHLDGAGAARHIDALLEVPGIQAIQFTPGEGTPSALPWIDMFKKIQSRGRSVLIIAPAHEVLPLCDALKPEGLAFLATGAIAGESDEVFAQVCTRFGAKS